MPIPIATLNGHPLQGLDLTRDQFLELRHRLSKQGIVSFPNNTFAFPYDPEAIPTAPYEINLINSVFFELSLIDRDPVEYELTDLGNIVYLHITSVQP